MKPGKFILDWEFKIVDLYDLQTNKCLIELDNRFIDREDEQEITKRYLELNLKDDYKAMQDLILAKYKEELKDKIIILFKKRLDDKVINDENFLGFNDFKCDILELLK